MLHIKDWLQQVSRDQQLMPLQPMRTMAQIPMPLSPVARLGMSARRGALVPRASLHLRQWAVVTAAAAGRGRSRVGTWLAAPNSVGSQCRLAVQSWEPMDSRKPVDSLSNKAQDCWKAKADCHLHLLQGRRRAKAGLDAAAS